jgi:hypothetical protein
LISIDSLKKINKISSHLTNIQVPGQSIHLLIRYFCR